MRMMREASKEKGLLGFGTGVSYGTAPHGAQTYSANQLAIR